MSVRPWQYIYAKGRVKDFLAQENPGQRLRPRLPRRPPRGLRGGLPFGGHGPSPRSEFQSCTRDTVVLVAIVLVAAGIIAGDVLLGHSTGTLLQ